MIDIENEIIDTVRNALISEFETISITTDPHNTPSVFPCVTIIEEDNSIDTNGIDSGGIENFANLSYEINVYSNAKNKKKTECKKIRDIVDNVMVNELGFQRNFARPLPTDNVDLYRIFLRYVAKVDANKNIYRR